MADPPRSELMAPPAAGRVFAGEARTGLADVAPSGRVRLDALARWLQDVAYADVADADVADDAIWVLRRVRLRVQRFPRFDGTARLRTYCTGIGRAWAERQTLVEGAGGALQAVALWVHLDPVTLRPSPLSPVEAAVYGEAGGERRVRARLHHPGPPPGAKASAWTFRPTEVDLARHVNNSAYWQPVEADLLAGPEPAGFDGEMEFRVPAQPGEVTVLRDAGGMWIVGADGTVHASLLGCATT
ncbi:MAG: thioesterase [Solirubrobacteraceae bacterium]